MSRLVAYVESRVINSLRLTTWPQAPMFIAIYVIACVIRLRIAYIDVNAAFSRHVLPPISQNYEICSFDGQHGRLSSVLQIKMIHVRLSSAR